jgi:sterol desaturase/sphingolipid hydroxylase (fatty acid hydroxylase superfamily)
MIDSLLSQLSGPSLALVVTVGAAVFLAVRYVAIAGGALWFVMRFADQLGLRRIQKLPFTREQLWREARFSAMTIGIFALLAAAITALTGQLHFAQAAMPSSAAESAWAVAAVPIALMLHDFYFYWMHRLIHVDWIYPHVHRVHHLSTNPSPLAALAFHPWEALIEALGVLAILTFVPLPLPSLIVFSLLAFSFNVLGHIGYELFPARLMASGFGRWINSATSHNLHHRTFRYHYGLYTLIWDRAFGTIDPRYDERRLAAA